MALFPKICDVLSFVRGADVISNLYVRYVYVRTRARGVYTYICACDVYKRE